MQRSNSLMIFHRRFADALRMCIAIHGFSFITVDLWPLRLEGEHALAPRWLILDSTS